MTQKVQVLGLLATAIWPFVLQTNTHYTQLGGSVCSIKLVGNYQLTFARRHIKHDAFHSHVDWQIWLQHNTTYDHCEHQT